MRSYGSNFFRGIKHPPQIAYSLGLSFLIGRFVLLLDTTGRKTGKQRTTPLQYEQIDGIFYTTSVKGLKADWVRNIQADPAVSIRVKNATFDARAEVTSNVAQIADFIEYRILQHPRMIKAIMYLDGLPFEMTRQQLEDYAQGMAVVKVYPENN